VLDYAGAWCVDRGRCFKAGLHLADRRTSGALPKAAHPGRMAAIQGSWLPLDACEEHCLQLDAQPHA
jgi:hypothetical protein